MSTACQVCGESFESVRLLEGHMKTHPKPYRCDRCGTSFFLPGQRADHRCVPPPSPTPNNCMLCGASFPSQAHLKLHLREHLPDGFIKHSLTCDICGESYKDLHMLQLHR
ncbi:unnamed protein product [Cyprideis torosa]|uniref:Uncharacterized protein n=1 Tax=Cyprideis torosa TaxID=163714 RepID=A0A7R8WXF9_9CRUS|nr:unnamed protein product [Cyprideis torosa]CAG0909020.1 unnamed protein product [Cyprideis torosa]